MSKIAIISRPDEGVLIDVGGCSTMQEAIQQLTSTLQVSSQFWRGVHLELTSTQVAHILAIAKGVGAAPREVFASNDKTRLALQEQNVKLGKGVPMALPELSNENATHQELAQDEEGSDEERAIISPNEQEDVIAIVYESQEAQELVDSQEDVDSGQPATSKKKIDLPLRSQPALPAVLYLRQTLRSGQTVSHKGHLVIIGDVNPGAEVMAEGDITVWGALRGIAHAGIGGNIQSEIRALKLQPIQIRIAHAIARAPDRPRVRYASKVGPEVAKIVDGKIRITRSKIE
jgi:septum site-determining protein MinC